ncbi:hypothetical protein RV02_GL003106 [Enterococcus gilvus]|nr:hypothetical protein RV02_GL003106 [Enterococcus gilvus]
MNLKKASVERFVQSLALFLFLKTIALFIPFYCHRLYG